MISSVPGVLDYLVRTWSQALPGVQVTDGQPLDMVDDVVCVGFTGQPGDAVVRSGLDPDSLSATSDREEYTVTSVLSSWRGREPSAKVVRDVVYAIAGTMAAEIARDPTLGGLVLTSRLSASDLTQYQTDDGATTLLQVDVSVVGIVRY